MKKLLSTLQIFSFIVLVTLSGKISAQAASPVIRLKMDVAAFNDETVFYFQQGGLPAFQSAFDAYKLLYNAGTLPYIASMSDSILTSISGLPELPANLSIPVKAFTPSTQNFTFSAEYSDFPANVCVTLEDLFTGISTKILTSNYVCTLYDTTTIARFKLNVFTGSIEASSFIKQADCASSKGMITIQSENNSTLNYEWKSGATVIKTSLNKCTADSLFDLPGGQYSVKVSDAAGCSSFSKSFVLDNVVATTASFTANSMTTSVSKSGYIDFTNKSTNAQFSSWTFGDNSGTYYVPSSSHNYLAPGIYTVILTTESITHCKDQTQQVIKVINDVTGLSKYDTNSEIRLAAISPGNYDLNISFNQATDVTVNVFDLNGKLLKTTALQQILTTKEPVDFSSFVKGMYLIKVGTENGEKTFKVIN